MLRITGIIVCILALVMNLVFFIGAEDKASAGIVFFAICGLAIYSKPIWKWLNS